MNKTFLLPLILTLNFIFIKTPLFACDVMLSKTEIINSEFYIDYTKAVESIFIKHGYRVVANSAPFSFAADNFITTGTNYFRLKQVNIDFKFKGHNTNLEIHELKNCMNVSCASNNYLKALRAALKSFDLKLNNCETIDHH